MSNLTPLPANAQLRHKPADHSWVSVDETVPFFAQATFPVNQFAIPPYNEIALTNSTAGNPVSAVYLKDSTTVATLVFTYDGDDFMTNAKIVYPA
jgi:hypothetical protein